MPEIRIVTESQLRELVTLDQGVIAAISDGFAALATKKVGMPPILRLDIPEHRGEVDVKTAYVPGLPSFALKVSPGFFGNPALGLPSVNGLMMLMSARTGLVEALFLDNGYLTDLRTAAAGALAASHLSREDAGIAAIFGAGVQALLQLEALTLVRPIAQARIWARDPAKARALASRASAALNIAVTAHADPRAAISGADIVVTTTPSSTPILRADWLEAGQHVTAMGSDAEHKNEIEPQALLRADLYVADSLVQTRRLGELHHAIAAGLWGANAPFAELGAIVAGAVPGRTAGDRITICDLTGTGVQDTAIATLVHRRVLAAGAGTVFTS
ncbi:ectoine utilization protein EutC [Fulvimarina sp. 2208YS6-2-32]|uniref:Ectoine utilization protein EutC n=1 Tax=Fulvimarina uroteuthidis TaxID=3098149 RepID=A0ABU5I0A9_9HYPH|nr:ectoine utilization protein EutC [Fulvimarina sp. 2208YS6-2-32]MDY8108826.1 ectoine utilization protein EutC [Fulvimarina sp. 2208YS6-2-32]